MCPIISVLTIFGILYRDNYEKIFRTVYFYTQNKYVSEEAVQLAFIQAFKKIENLSDKEKFASWVTVIAINEAKRIYNKQVKEKVVPIDEKITSYTSENHFLDVEIKIDIENIFLRLKPLDAQILGLLLFLLYMVQLLFFHFLYLFSL
ncbi:MAG: RNA polymerase sigma factor [Desulfitobacterium sp.]